MGEVFADIVVTVSNGFKVGFSISGNKYFHNI